MLIQSKFKYDSKVAGQASKLAYKLNKKTKDKIVFWSIPIAFAIMVGILIYDIIKQNSLVLDIVLLSILVVIEAMNLFMPLIISKMQAKYFKKIDELNYDYFISEYNKGIFKEKIYKDNQIIVANEVGAEKFSNYGIFDHYLVVVFNNFAMLLFDMNEMQSGTKDDLLNTLNECKNINKYLKNKKRK